MDDTISRKCAIDALCAACGKACDKSKFVYNATQDEQVILCPEHYCLCTLPSAQPMRGRWISADAMFGGVPFYCSECGENTRDTVMGKPRWNFCPNCGADMRQREE